MRLFKQQSGQGLIETTVAIGVIITAIIGTVSLASFTVRSTRSTLNRLIAQNLAWEAIEVATNLRDSNLVAGDPFDTTLNGGGDTSAILTFDPSNNVWLVNFTPSSFSDALTTMYLQNGLYIQGVGASSGTATPFQRLVTLTPVSAGQFDISAEVIWNERGSDLSVSAERSLYDWRAGTFPSGGGGGGGAICGNGGAPEAGEQCDDGNTVNGDGCSSTCTIEAGVLCGNGNPDPGEACDDGDTTDAGICNANCSAFTSCGDGTVQNPNGNGGNETCEPPNSGSCNANCLSYLTYTNPQQIGAGCDSSQIQMTLSNNTGDPTMSLGNYTWGWGVGGSNTCDWINYTDQASMVGSINQRTGANDPSRRFIYMAEEGGGCSGHNFRIYDRNTDSVRTAFIPAPCSTINYTGNDKMWIADQVAAQMGW